MVKATVPASLDGIYFDAIITRETTYESDVPEYPIETGFYVTDAILRKPVTLNVKAFISNSPVTWRHLRSSNRLSSTVKKLEELYFSGKLVTFSTSKKVYTSMAITSITVPETEEMANAVEVSITLKQVRVTKSKTKTIPADYGLGGDTAESGGTANTTEEKEEGPIEKACSWLFGLFKK